MNGIKAQSFVDYYIIPDRRKAINYALEIMSEGDVTVIAGKGAEKYQEIKGVKYPFSDREVVMRAIKEIDE